MSDKINYSLVLAITGSIAAFKGAELCSLLVKNSFDVNVIMTESAQKLVTPLTFQTLSRNQVVTSLWNMPDWQPGHIALAEKTKLLVVAPCTANFIAKLANGIADDALSTYALSHTGKILLAPAMNPRMWANPAVRLNCQIIKERGVLFVGPDKGRVACGEDGEGRMSEVSDIFAKIKELAR